MLFRNKLAITAAAALTGILGLAPSASADEFQSAAKEKGQSGWYEMENFGQGSPYASPAFTHTSSKKSITIGHATSICTVTDSKGKKSSVMYTLKLQKVVKKKWKTTHTKTFIAHCDPAKGYITEIKKPGKGKYRFTLTDISQVSIFYYINGAYFYWGTK